ncbi:MAG: phage tail sheath C-terminal domain-containing protein [Ferruginibacter sp.]
MPVLPTYPGVYIEELSSGVRTITGVATSITAFIGRARKGPTDEAVQIFNFGDYERKFGGLWDKSTMSFAVRDFFLNGGGMAVIVRVHNGALPAELRIPTGQPDPDDELNLVAVDPGTWGDKLGVTIDYNTKDKNAPLPDNKLFNITIIEDGGLNEKFFNVTLDKTKSGYLPRVLEQGSTLVRVKKDAQGKDIMPAFRPLETPKNVVVGPQSPLASPPMSPVGSPPGAASSSTDGSHIGDAQIFGAGMEANKTGMFLLEKTDLFNILCIPPYTSSDPPTITLDPDEKPTDVSTDLIAAADAYCKKRRAFFIVDPHSTWKTMSDASDGLSTLVYPKLTSNYSGLFFPRLKQTNPLKKNQVEEFVPCGAVAGIFARTDGQRGVWKAPAGQDATLVGVDQLSVPLTDSENGVLNQIGINCLRSFPVYGRLVWGARTLEGADQLASEWKYIPVRRTALFIEESLYRGTKWVVFEPNDEPLWAQIRLNIGAFMHNLFRQGAFQGKTPREAYLVKCDKETTTQNDINSGIVNILVGFAPLKPAEFVMIKIQQLAGQIES